MTTTSKAPNYIGQFWTGRALNALGFRREAELTIWPGFDLVLRKLLAQPFLASGVIKLGNLDQAMFLVANEYPVSWASPAVATFLGIGVELGAGLLLTLGLFTRIAGALLAAMAMVIQTVYQPLDLNLH